MAVLPTLADVLISFGDHHRPQMSSCHLRILVTNYELKLEGIKFRRLSWGSKIASGSALSFSCASPNVFWRSHDQPSCDGLDCP